MSEHASVRQVIEMRFLRGRGTSLDDPIRVVTQYRALDGELLAEVDSHTSATAAPSRDREPR